MSWIDDVVREVAELPDRNSPEGQPEMMLVTADELRDILLLAEADSEAIAQLRHLIDDITHCPSPADPKRRTVKPGAGLMFSNMVNASISLLTPNVQIDGGAAVRASQSNAVLGSKDEGK